MAAAFALLQPESRQGRATVGLALELAGSGTLDPVARGRLLPGSPLHAHGLVVVAGEGPFLTRSIRVPDRVLAHLLGGDEPEPSVRAASVEGIPTESATGTRLGRALRQGAPFVWLRESPGSAALSVATGALDALEIPSMAIDARRLREPVGESLAAAVLEAGLRCAALIVLGADAVVQQPALLAALDSAAVPVIACGALRWDPGWLAALPPVFLAPPLAGPDRERLWTALLGEPVEQGRAGWRELVALAMTPEDMARVVRLAAQETAAREEPLTVAAVLDATRRLGGAGVTGASAVTAVAGFGDLVLPAEPLEAVRELVGWAKHRDAVLAQGPLAGAGGKGRGIAAMFTGNPGTGKTLAAQVVASSLGLDLHTVDLSSVVDKYIGETEKNLERVFREAETLNTVLFFDEADALFGNRSEVKDARDRYANQEISYLLQRMEAFNGIAILATNLRGNLDVAFSRRLHFIIHFPDPDVATRKRLWDKHLSALPGLDPSDPVDTGLLAERTEVAGGDIRNIVLAAAYAAAEQERLVGATILAWAVEREYRKLGRRTPERGFR